MYVYIGINVRMYVFGVEYQVYPNILDRSGTNKCRRHDKYIPVGCSIGTNMSYTGTV